MIKDLRYPLKQRPFPQRTLVLAVPRRVGLWVGLLDFEVQVGLDLDLDFYFESGGLWFGLLDLKSNSESDFGLDLDLKSNAESDFGLDLDLKSRTLVGLGLLARKPDFGKVRGRGIGLWFWTWTSCASLVAGWPMWEREAVWRVRRACYVHIIIPTAERGNAR